MPNRPGLGLKTMPTWFAISMPCLSLCIGYIVWAQSQFRSYQYSLDFLVGSRIQIVPDLKFLGVHEPDETFRTVITLRNHGHSTVKVVGAMTNCSCLALDGLPARIAPDGSIQLPIQVRFGKTPGQWRQSIRNLTDHPHDRELTVSSWAHVATAEVSTAPKAPKSLD